MANIIGGHESGLLDSSLYLLNRNDRNSQNSPGHGERQYVNVSNGNLILQQQDAFLPSLGDDFSLIRTYNSRGRTGDAQQIFDGEWSFSSLVRLTEITDGEQSHFEVEFGDGSVFTYTYDTTQGCYLSTEGAGAYETLQDLGSTYLLTRADGHTYSFDSLGRLLEIADPNGVKISYVYSGSQLVQVLDDQGHIINYTYQNGLLTQVTDETQTVLAQYHYTNGQLSEVIDRDWHSTKYYYDAAGSLSRIVLPESQAVDGLLESYATRELNFTYDSLNWRGNSLDPVRVLTQIADAEGNVTSFDYDFQFSHGGSSANGTTTVVDTLGNSRAYSNAAEYQQWRLDNGYYQTYDANQAATDPSYQAQVDAIRNAHAMAYTYRDDGYITEVVDQQGFHTQYSYDAKGNLTDIIDATGWGVLNSDSNYYRQLRAELGVVDAGGNGKLVANLTAQELNDLQEAYTSHFEYDEHGNLTKSIDNADNETIYTYTEFNKLASITSPMGTALTTLDEEQYHQKLFELGFGPDGVLPDTAALADGGYVTVYSDEAARDDGTKEIRLQRYDATGQPVGERVHVNTRTSSTQTYVRVTGLNDGGYVVTWSSYNYDGSGWTVSAQRYDASGQPVGGETIVNTTTSDHQLRSSVGALADGGYVVTWQSLNHDGDNYGIYGQRFDAAGNTVGGEFQVNTYTADKQTQPEITGLPDGGFVVVWMSNNQDGSYWGVFGQRFNAAGVKVGSEFQLSTTYANHQEYPVITTLPDGGFVTLWMSYLQDGSGWGVYGQRFNAAGTAVGGEFLVNTKTGGSQNYPRVAVTPDGGFVVAWQSNNQDGSGLGVYGQCFDAAGNKIGGEFHAAETTLENQRLPAVVVLNDGAIVVTCESLYRQEGETSYTEILQSLIPAGQAQSGSITGLVETQVSYLRASEISTADKQTLQDLYTTYYEYDSNQNLIERRDPGGDITRFEYDANGNLTQKTVFLDAADLVDPAKQQITTYAYDGFGNRISSTDAEGNQSFSEYDHFGNLLRFTDANGGVTQFTYDADNRLLTVTDPEGQLTTNAYDAVGNRIAVTDANGHTVTRVYDRNNNLLSILDPSETDPAQDRLSQFEYDVVGNQTAVIDAEGNRSEYHFNVRRELVEVLSAEVDDENGTPTQYLTSYAYDGVGNRIATTDRNGNTTEILYTQNNLVRQQTDADGQVTRYEYDANGNQVKIIAGYQLALDKRQILQFDYDEENQLITSTDAEGNVTQYSYDAIGNVLATTDANGNITTYEYDGNNRLLKETLPQVTDPETQTPVNYTVEHHYDANGNELETIDENGQSTRYTFDRNDRLVMVEDANGVKTVYQYDSRNNRTAVLIGVEASADANGQVTVGNTDQAQVTRYTYNEFNDLIAKTDGVGIALTESDDPLYRELRQELGYGIDGYRPDTAALADGGYVTVYTDEAVHPGIPKHELYLQRYDASGQPVGERVHVNTFTYSNQNYARVTGLNDGGYLVTWSSYSQDGSSWAVCARRYDASGQAVGGETVVNTTTYSSQLYSSVAALSDGGYVITWQSYAQDGDNYGIYGQRFNAQGQAVGSEFQINTYTTDKQYWPEVTRLADGGFVVVWMSYLQDGSLWGVYGQRFDAAGNTVGSEFQVNTTTANHQDYPVVTALADGGFVVAWMSNGQDGSGWGVYGQRYSATGAPVGGEFLVNSYISSHQAHPRVAVTPDGGFVVVWHSNGQDGSDYGIYGQCFDAAGNKVGDEFLAVKTTEGKQAFPVVTVLNDGSIVVTYESFYLLDKGGVTHNEILQSLIPAGQVQAGSITGMTEHKVTGLLESDKQALLDLYTTHYAYDKLGHRIGVTDAMGNTTGSGYDALNRLVSTTDALGNVTSFAYDGNGNLGKQTDAEGRITTFTYDSANRLTQTTDPLGTITQRSYDSFGNLLSETQGFGTAEARSSSFDYDLNNRLVQATDPEGAVSSYEYDAVGNRIRVTDGRGNATQYLYDALNRNIKVIDPLNFETQFEYDGVGNRLSLIDARGGISRFDYDPGNRLIQTTDAEGRITAYSYDVRGNRIEQRTAVGTAEEALTRYEYDATNHLRKVIDAAGGVTEQNYDRVYNRTQITDANGNITTSEFDAANRVLRVTDAAGGVTAYSYDAVGNRLSRTDALGRVTSYDYDNKNQLIQETSAGGIQTTYAYDKVGNRIGITHAAGTVGAATETFVYDKDNRLLSRTDALGQTTSYAYDANGNSTQVTDAEGNATIYTYDADNRVTQIQDPEGNLVQYVYDANGNRTQVTDGLGSVTTSYFNADNQVTLTVDGEGYATGYSYDDNGNLISRTLHMQALTLPVDPASQPTPAADPADQVTQFEYDNLNRLTARVDGEGYRTEYVYDAVGNRIETRQFRDLTGTDVAVSFSYYDESNRQIARLSAEGFLTTFDYDAVGNLISQTTYDQQVSPPASGAPTPVAGDTGRTRTLSYDAVNRLVRETSPLGVFTDYEYDSRGNRTAAIEASGTSEERRTEYVYDAANRLTDTTDALGNVTHLTLDANGNVTARRDAYGTSQARLTSYAYDSNNRLISETDPQGIVSEMTYDANGNLLSRTEAVGKGVERTETFEYDHDNRLVAQTNGTLDRTEYQYDGAGNRTKVILAPGLPEEQSNSFEYDADNRLLATVDGTGVRTEYRYDGAGNKVETIQATGVSGEERHSSYQYDLDGHLTQVTDPLGSITRYSYDVLGNQTQIVNANGGVQTNSFDLLGRLVSSTSAGGIKTTNSYDARGNIISTTQSFADGSDARTTTYGYDLLNRQVLITDPEGFSTSIEYDAVGNQTLITHGQYLLQPGDTGYDAAKAARAFAQSNSFTYDKADRMLSMTDGVGNITTYTYNAVGNRVSMTEASNSAPRTTTYSYDKANRLLQTNTPAGGKTKYTYDAAGNRITEKALVSPTGSPNVWATTSFEYDANGRLIAEVDPYGVRTEYEYDALGNQVTKKLAAGSSDHRITYQEYDLNNRLSAEIDGEGQRTEYQYDSLGNRIKVTDALGRVAHYYYDGSNNLTTILDPEGYLISYSYDAAGNRTGETVHITKYTGAVNDLVAPTVTTSGNDRTTQTVYDGNGQAIEKTAADGTQTVYSYDGAGNLSEEVQFANTTAPRTLHYQYDLDNRLTTFTDADGTVTTFSYDGANNKTSETITSSTATTNPAAFQAMHDSLSLTNEQYVNLLYTEVLGRPGEASGIAYWTGLLNAGTKNREQVTFAFFESPEYLAQTHNDTNLLLQTTYAYDLNNRLIQQVFDPTGLNLVQTLDYDNCGNVITKTDANGHATSFTYDKNNRVTSQTDALGNTTQFAYDKVGNRTGVTDARGNITNYVYDDNNRMIQELAPSVTIYTVENGFETLQPTTTHSYDAAGNETQTIDAAGYKTTRYYDKNNRLVAQINGDNVLKTWTYSAFGDKATESLYMTRLAASAHNPAVLPATPGGDVQTISFQYDKAGRTTRIIYPAIEVTTLSGTGGSNPSAGVATLQPDERFTYDGFGNQVEAFDRNGNRTLSYYDVKGRLVAQVDAEGYLTEFDYDAQDNMLTQRVYTQALNPASLTSANRPNPPSGSVQQTDRSYDAASRVIEESSPLVDVFDPATLSTVQKRVVTRYAYDDVGNQIRKTLAADSSQETIEYSYFDALNRRVAVVDGNRVVTTFSYDGNGNQTQAKRFYKAVGAGVNLTTLSGSTNFASLVGTSTQDQTINHVYDAVNRQTSETELMGSGAADDLMQTISYDAQGNRTRVVDADGFVLQYRYDGLGQLVEHVNDDGSGMTYVYNAAGNQVGAFTGQLHGWMDPPTNVTASFGNDLTINWTLNEGANGSTYVVFDSASRSSIASYGHQSAIKPSWGGNSYATALSTAGFTPGQQLYFRVVNQDVNGNLSWSAEQKVTIPPRLTDVNIAQVNATTLTVTVQFESGTVSPKLYYGAIGATNTLKSLTNLGGGKYQATLSGLSNPQSYAYRLTWQDAQGHTYNSSEVPFEARSEHAGISSVLSKSTVVDGSGTHYKINMHTVVPTALAQDLENLAAQWVRTDVEDGASGLSSVTSAGGGSGYSNFDLVLGANTPLDAGTYQVTLVGAGSDGDLILDTFSVVVGSAALNTTERSVSWNVPAAGDDQLVIVNGQRVSADLVDDRLLVDPNLSGTGTVGYDAFYGDASSETHSAALTSNAVPWYDLSVAVHLKSGVAANAVGGIHLAWKATGSGSWSNDQLFSLTSTTPGETIPAANNINFNTVLNQIEAELRPIHHQELVSDGESSWWQTVYDYTGSRNEVLRKRAVDLGVNVSAYDSKFHYAYVYDGESGHYEWTSNVLSYPTDLRNLLIAMGYTSKLQANAIDPTYNQATYNYSKTPRILAGQYDVKIYYLNSSGQQVILDQRYGFQTQAGSTLNGSYSSTYSYTKPNIAVSYYDVGLSLDLNMIEKATVNGNVYLAWRTAGSGSTFSNSVALTPGAVHNSSELPSAGNVNFSALLTQLEAELRAYHYTQTLSDGESTWTETVYPYTGSRNEILRKRAQDVGVVIGPYDQAFVAKTVWFTDGENSYSQQVWSEDVLNHPEELRNLLIAAGYSDRLQAYASNPSYFQLQNYTTSMQLATGQYDYKIYYYDTQGREVIVDWARASTSTANTAMSGQSLAVAAYEDGGTLTLASSGLLTVDPGLYHGHRAEINESQQLSLTATGQGSGSQEVFNSNTGYSIENRYNALNEKVASNVNAGVWEEYGVDANGNVVTTSNLGIDGVGSAITSFTTYDKRNRVTAEFSAPVAVAGQSGTHRAVTRKTYDVNDKVITETDPQGNQVHRTWNALGLLVSESNQLNATVSYGYDLLGNRTKETDALGHSRYQFFDAVGNLTQTVDGEGHATSYSYDVFGRRTSVSNALGQSVQLSYDQRDRLISATDALGKVTSYAYDGRDNRTSTIDANGHEVTQTYDAFNRVTETLSYQDGQEVSAKRLYDGNGNLLAEVDAEGGITVNVYGAYGRLDHKIDAAGQIIYYSYDDQGNQVREWNPTTGQDIRHVYDAAGQLLEVNDLGTGVKTVYSYDAAGHRMSEVVTTPGNAHNRTISYQYDAVGQMVRWADAVTGMNTNYQWDVAGNLHRALTDLGYDPQVDNLNIANVLSHVEAQLRAIHYTVDDGEGGYGYYPYTGTRNEVIRARAAGLGIDISHYDNVFGKEDVGDGEYIIGTTWSKDLLSDRPELLKLLTAMGYTAELQAAIINSNYRLTDHQYSYNANNLVTQITQNGAIESQYGYDAAGNRTMFYDQGTTTTYQFDANGRVISAKVGGVTTADWQYDDVGNVTRFRTFKANGNVDQVTTNLYYENNRNYQTTTGSQTTTQTLDLNGRTLKTTVVDGSNTFIYDHSYNAAGQEVSIAGRGGDMSGNTVNTYDVNGKLVESNKGKAEGKHRAEVLRFVYNNDGQILYRFHDTGKGGDVYGFFDAIINNTEFAYANGNPVGQTGSQGSEANVTLLDTKQYNLVQPLGEDLPVSTVNAYTVHRGDTLQSIAAAAYGNASLWFVLAEANNLDPATPLREGQQIEIPNTVKSGRLSADTHAIYQESEIIGSTLPNLKAPPADKGCGSFLAIIIVAIIAVVATILTAGAAGVIADALFSSSFAASTAGTLLSFAIAGALVGAAASIVQQGLFMALGYQDKFSWKSVASGAVSGMFSGAAQGLGKLVEASKFAGEALTYAKTATRALNVASAASKQLIENGKITSWASLAGAALGPVKGVKADGKVGTLVQGVGYAEDGAREALGTVLSYTTPWLGVAESYIRTGEVSPATWASAIGGTISTAVGDLGISGPQIGNTTAGQLATNLLVGGALSRVDRQAGMDYLANAVGQEVGGLILDRLGSALLGPGAPAEPQKAYWGQSDMGDVGTDISRQMAREAELAEALQMGPDSWLVRDQGLASIEAREADLAAALQMGPDGWLARDQGMPESPISQYTVAKGDSFAKIARQQLGPNASEAEVQQQTLALMEMNQGVDPRSLQIGQTIELVAPGAGVNISDETIGRLAASDAELREYYAAKAEQAFEADVAQLERAARIGAGDSQLVLGDSIPADLRSDVENFSLWKDQEVLDLPNGMKLLSSHSSPTYTNTLDCHPGDPFANTNIISDTKNMFVNLIDEYTPFVKINEQLKSNGYGSLYPDARILTGKVSSALFAGGVAGADLVVNSESGELTLFFYGGAEGGLVSPGVSVGAGFVMNAEVNDRLAKWSGDITGGWGPVSATAFASLDTDKPDFLEFDIDEAMKQAHGATINADFSLFDGLAMPNLSTSRTYSKNAVTVPFVGYLMDPVGTFFNWLD